MRVIAIHLVGVFVLLAGSSVAQQTEVQSSPPVQYSTYFNSKRDSAQVSRLLQMANPEHNDNVDSSLILLLEALEIVQDNISDADHPLLDSCYTFLAWNYYWKDDFETGLPIVDSALGMSHRLYPAGHAITIDQYILRGKFLEDSEPEEAKHSLDSALTMIQRLQLQTDPKYANLYYDAAFLRWDLGQLEGVDTLLVHSLALQRKTGRSIALARRLADLAWYFLAYFQLDTAKVWFQESIVILRQDTLDRRSEIADALHGLALCSNSEGDVVAADSLFTKTIALYRSIKNIDAQMVSDIEVDVAAVKVRAGKFDEAGEILYRAYGEWKDSEDAQAHVSRIVRMLSYYHMERGEYAEAEEFIYEDIELSRAVYGENTKNEAIAFASAGSYFSERGRFDEAIYYYEEARGIIDSIYVIEPVSQLVVLSIYENLAAAYYYSGYVDAADSIYTEALDFAHSVLPDSSPELALSLAAQCKFYIEYGNLTKAGELIAHAENITRVSFSEPHEIAAKVLHGAAEYHAVAGDQEEAASRYREAMEMFQILYPPHHDLLILIQKEYGELLAEQGKVQQASEYYEQMLEGVYYRLRESFGFEGEGRQLAFMKNVLKPNLNSFSKFCVHHHQESNELSSQYLNALLKLKGAIVNETRRHREVVMRTVSKDDTVARRLHARLTAIRERQAYLATHPTSASLDQERQRIRENADEIDSQLRRILSNYRPHTSRQHVEWTDIQKTLKANEAVIEFTAIEHRRHSTQKAEVEYAAVVLRPAGKPVIVKLCKERDILDFIETGPKGQAAYLVDKQAAVELYNAVWKPVDSVLQGATSVFIAPDGLLHRIAFSALYTNESGYLDDVLHIGYITSGLQLLRRTEASNDNARSNTSTAFLVGNPDYDAAPVYPKRTKKGADPLRGGWERLPGTAAEISEIKKLSEEIGLPVLTFTDGDAREDTLKVVLQQPPRILHFATHGYFYPELISEEEKHLLVQAERSGSAQLRLIDNPLLRSGLLLAGANRIWTGKSPALNSNDGVLTALEISRMNLTGTELVTLSACQTALGDVRNGEGILGLQRAIQVAGADAILMSLWRIPDTPTAELMAAFYERYLGGTSKLEAFREARKEIRARYPSPYVWAAFKLLGE